jgi:hypothetical protein
VELDTLSSTHVQLTVIGYAGALVLGGVVRRRFGRRGLRAGDRSCSSPPRLGCVRTRIVATLLRFDEVLSRPAESRDILGVPQHRALARRVAAAWAVLLRNEMVNGARALPFRSDVSVAVTAARTPPQPSPHHADIEEWHRRLVPDLQPIIQQLDERIRIALRTPTTQSSGSGPSTD